MSLRVLNFANLRLGSAFVPLGVRGRDMRAQLVATLAHVGDLAIKHQVDAVLISGDLFGCTAPAASTLKYVQSFFTGLQDAHIASVILPGERDPEGIYDSGFQPDSQNLFPGSYVLGPDMPFVRHPTADLDVYSVLLASGASSVVSSRAPIQASTSRVALGVGYWSGKAAPDLTAMAEAAATAGLRYVGVGGSPSFDSGTIHGSVACSPGVPEAMDWDHSAGTIALVQFDDLGNCQVEQLATGSLRFVRLEYSISSENARPVGRILSEMGDPRVSLEIVLTGICPAETLIDPSSLEEEFANRYFSLRIVDRTELQIDAGRAVSLPRGTVVGNFARIIDGRINGAADGEEAGLQREAYRLAMHLLQGGHTS
jgi:hypothetical protein